MRNSIRQLGALGMLFMAGACMAQDHDPGSPRTGNAERGRVLLSILGPRPQDGSGITPLQQQELNRRVRCAATRQEIQDQLDFEATGSAGYYPMEQLRFLEKEACAPVPLQPGFEQAVIQQAQPVQPVPEFRPPPQRAASAAPPVQQPPPQRPAVQAPPRPAVQQPVVQQPAPPPVQRVAAQPAPPPPAAAQPAGPSFTPAPDYPAEEKAAGHEGTVLVQLIMDANGVVTSATIAKSSNFPALDAAALTVAKTWRIPAAHGRTIDVPLKFSAN